MFDWISSAKLSADLSPSKDDFSSSASLVLTSRMGLSCMVAGVSLPSPLSPERFLQHITFVGVAFDGAAAAAVAFDGAAAAAVAFTEVIIVSPISLCLKLSIVEDRLKKML